MKIPKILIFIFISLFASAHNRAVAQDKPSTVEGTKWAGTDSDGDFYEYEFLRGGQLRYRTNTGRTEMVSFEDKGDVWSQNGSIIIVVKGSSSVQVGKINGNRMTGEAWNVNGRRWTWQAAKL
jgi:hypothetical protein